MRTMALYCIGDVQGCDSALERLLDTIGFSPSRDTVFLLGDLVNRGPASAKVLRRVQAYGAAVRSLLGNHDLHLLAVAHGVRKPHGKDTIHDVLEAPDRHALLDWLRHQSMALHQKVGDRDLLMVHAGVLPQWSLDQTLDLAAEIEATLRSNAVGDFLHHMYGDQSDRWSDTLQGYSRLRVIVNALTRLRFCTPDGVMEFKSKDSNGTVPAGHLPWFDVPTRQTAGITVAFGHWSTLGWLTRKDVLSLDTGCVWGGCLSAARLGATPNDIELIQIDCDQAQAPF